MNREVYYIRATHCREPEFKDLMNYVGKETYLVNDTLFSKETVEQYLEKRDVKIDKKNKTVRSYAIKYGEDSKNVRRDKCVKRYTCHDLCMIVVYSCPK